MACIDNAIGQAIGATPKPRCCIDRHLEILPRHVSYMAAPTGALWPNGSVLSYAFENSRGSSGSTGQRSMVVQAFGEWARHANLSFTHRQSNESTVRIAFEPGGSWSYIGTQVKQVPSGERTMNVGWSNDYGMILHEIGHSLGLIHEHQSPAAGIRFNAAACYRYFGGPPNYWSPEDVKTQVLDRYAQGTITNSVFDPYSIMEYWFDPSLLEAPLPISGPNQNLSALDIITIKKLYPKAA